MQKETATNLVANSASSIFTKEDVLNILNLIDAPPSTTQPQPKEKTQSATINRETIALFIELIEDKIRYAAADDVVDFQSAEYSLSGNEIILEDVNLNEDYLIETFTDLTNDFFSEYFEDAK
jgi:hypothetical protein